MGSRTWGLQRNIGPEAAPLPNVRKYGGLSASVAMVGLRTDFDMAFDCTQDNSLDLEALRLQRMDDKALQSFGRAAAFLCRPEQCHNDKPREVFVIQLQEARAEWRRRQKRVGLRNKAGHAFAVSTTNDCVAL
jgi:hypothetical protein